MEENHIHSTPSSHTLLHMAAGLLPMAATLLSLFTLSHVIPHSHFCSQLVAFYRQQWWLYLMVDAFVNGGCNHH